MQRSNVVIIASATLLLYGWLVPGVLANQQLRDGVNALADVYQERVARELRSAGYRILHREVYHHTQLLKLVRGDAIYNSSDIETFFRSANAAGSEFRAFIECQQQRTERKVRTWKNDTLEQTVGLLNETVTTAATTVSQIAAIRRDIVGRMVPIFEEAIRKAHAIITEASPRFAKIHELSTKAVQKLHAQAILDKKRLQRHEFTAKYLLIEEETIDTIEAALKESGQQILRIWNEYAAQTFENKAYLLALRNVNG